MSLPESNPQPVTIPAGEPLCALAELAPGHSKGFRVEGAETPVLVFLVHPIDAQKGEIYGYVNQCAHRSMPLDWVEGERAPDAAAGLGRCETGREDGARVFAPRCRIHLDGTPFRCGA